MNDLEWARAFVGCKIEGTGRRFSETVDVLVKKLAQARQETDAHLPAPGTIERKAREKPQTLKSQSALQASRT